jgi:glutamate 5-kinase
MYKRIIIKVGTKILSTADGSFDVAILKHLVSQIVTIKNKGIEVVLVTSGAVGAGRNLVKLKGAEKIVEKQVLAAVGQVRLMSTYAEAFAKQGEICAQVLVTKEDFRDKSHYFNMRTCFLGLLAGGVVPVVNENDVVATTELLFTDNDELAGLVASQLNADAVIILTSVEGFLTGDPNNKNSEVVPEIDFGDIGSYQKYISPEKTAFGRGGMLTKFNIAKKLALNGIVVHFANGKRKDVLLDLVAGKGRGTKFLPRSKSSAVKRRLAYSEGLTKGMVLVNKCAEDLLLSKTKIMSLLPVGVIGVKGDFKKGDIIEIATERGQKLGFGIAGYGALKAKELMGIKKARPVIHYNHMFIGA